MRPSPQRLLEIVPGLMTWATILLPIVLSFYVPAAVALFLLLFSVLWFFRSIEFSFLLITTYFQSRSYHDLPWASLVGQLQDGRISTQAPTAGQRRLLAELAAQLQGRQNASDILPPDQVYHLIIMATYREPLEVLRQTLSAICSSDYDPKRIIVLLAGEERDEFNFRIYRDQLYSEFSPKLAGFYSSIHPQDTIGEVRGKGANISYAAHALVPHILKDFHLAPEQVLVTTIDADNCVHPQYLACLTVHYCLSAERMYKSYQPLPLFYNNLWEVPLFNRIVALTAGFWHMIESGRPNRLRNFSSHAQPLSALLQTDYWSVTTIVEDGHQYWRSYFAFRGNYSVVPLFIPIYQDAVQNSGYLKTLWGQYKQLRRWSWGCSDIPFVLQKMWHMRAEIPWRTNLINLFRLVEGHYMWATAPVVISLTQPVPRLINQQFASSVVSYNLGVLLSNFFTLAMLGIVCSIWVTLLMVPPVPKTAKNRWWLIASQVVQWFCLPIITILFGALPALESQTRLMLGKYLDFQVTEKVRK